MSFVLGDLNGKLAQVIGDFAYMNKLKLVEQEDSYQVWLRVHYVHIEELGINVFSGEYHTYSEKTYEYEPTYNAYFFFDDKTGAALWAQVSYEMLTTIKDFCHLIELPYTDKEIEAMKCLYMLQGETYIEDKIVNKKSAEHTRK